MASQKPKLPEAIRLMDSTGLTLLDSVSCEYEDSFCLETFGDLVRAAAEVEPTSKSPLRNH